MDIFRKARHNYWARHVYRLWGMTPADLLLAEPFARDLILLLNELRGNQRTLLFIDDLDYIPIDKYDMKAAAFILNEFFDGQGSTSKILVDGGGISYYA
jgi:hypothetical protein